MPSYEPEWEDAIMGRGLNLGTYGLKLEFGERTIMWTDINRPAIYEYDAEGDYSEIGSAEDVLEALQKIADYIIEKTRR